MTITVINKDTVLYKMVSVTNNLTSEKQKKVVVVVHITGKSKEDSEI